MGIHGVDADEYIKKSNMKELHALVLASDKIITY